MIALVPSPEPPALIVVGSAEDDVSRQLARERRQRVILIEHLMALADEVTEALDRGTPSRALTCPRHVAVKDKRPTMCPICALCECRKRMHPVRGKR